MKVTRQPEFQLVEARGESFGTYHWPGSGATVLLIHATGFHSRVWDQVVANLPEFNCWAFDMRGHGRSSKPEPPYVWRNFGEDVVAVARSLKLKVDVGIGHSMGGHSIALAAALAPELFSSLILVDPIIIQEKHYGQAETKEHPVERRKNRWHSPEEIFERYHDKKPFDTWNRDVLRDYCQHALMNDTTSDGFVLACPPRIEGSIYNTSTDSEGACIYKDLKRVTAAVTVLHPPVSASKKIEDLISFDLGKAFADGRDEIIDGHSHFMPMESPVLVAQKIIEQSARVREKSGER
jgi:pimeloyl-ACP methyl ester carboxylesterase